MAKNKKQVKAKSKLTPHLKRVIAEGEKAWAEGRVIRIKTEDMIKFLRSLETNK